MNLNISTQFINNCLGNNVTKGNETNSTGFTNLLEELSSMNEDLNMNEDLDTKHLDSENNEDEKNIDYSFLLSLLNNIQNLEDLKKNNNPEKINLDDLLKIDSLSEILNGKTENSDSVLEKLNDLILNQDSDINKLSKEDGMLLDLIKESLQNKNSNNSTDIDSIPKDENDLENKNITNKLLENLGLETKPKENIQDKNGKNDLINTFNSKLKEQNSYDELETNSLINKNNIINTNNAGSKDKDLNTLESILDSKDKNSFININNINSNIATITNKQEVDTSSVATVRQEFIGEDIVKNINYMKSNGLEEIKIKLTPKELGDMTIKLVKTLEETKVHIIISKDDVFDLVNKNIGDISKHLKDLNINVKEVFVDVKSNNEKFFSDNLNQEFNKKNQQNKKQRNKFNNTEIEAIEEIKENKVLDSNLNILI